MATISKRARLRIIDTLDVEVGPVVVDELLREQFYGPLWRLAGKPASEAIDYGPGGYSGLYFALDGAAWQAEQRERMGR